MVTLLSSGARLRALVAAAAVLVLGATLLASGRSSDVPGFSIPPAYSAAVDYFLKIDGIDGESTDDRHRGELAIESFSWGVSNAGASAGGGGGGAGKASFQDIHFTMPVSKASPQLFLHAASGKHIPKAVLYGRKAGGGQQDFYKITLSDVLVTSYQSQGGGDVPTDSFSLNFTKIEFSYSPQKPDGSLDSPVVTGWDLKKNTK